MLNLNKIKIGWKEYEVQKVKSNQILFINGNECSGIIDFENNVIHLNENCTNEELEETLIHESLHGIEQMYNIELGEGIVTRLSNAIFTVLKDNNLKVVSKTP